MTGFLTLYLRVVVCRQCVRVCVFKQIHSEVVNIIVGTLGIAKLHVYVGHGGTRRGGSRELLDTERNTRTGIFLHDIHWERVDIKLKPRRIGQWALQILGAFRPHHWQPPRSTNLVQSTHRHWHTTKGKT